MSARTLSRNAGERQRIAGAMHALAGMATALVAFRHDRRGAGQRMRVLANLCIVPLGVGVSLSSYIAACERVLSEAGLTIELHANGTNIEGEWDAVFAAVKRCHEVVHGMGCPRIHTSVTFGTRTDREQTLADKLRSVAQKT
jgi:uncharacterized protein (TIGR00106 family)